MRVIKTKSRDNSRKHSRESTHMKLLFGVLAQDLNGFPLLLAKQASSNLMHQFLKGGIRIGKYRKERFKFRPESIERLKA
jgi:hypothetical protein